MPLDITHDNHKVKKYEFTIYHFKFNGKLDNYDFETFKFNFLDYLKKERYFGVIFDLKDVSSINPQLIIMQSEFMKHIENLSKQKLIASTILLEKEFIKKLLNGLFIIKKPTAPNLILKNHNEAIEFIKDCAFIDKRLHLI